MRGITIRFPDDSPLWRLPPGQRGAYVRQVFDALHRLPEILTALESRLAAVESQLAENLVETPSSEPAQAEKNNGPVFDIDSFLSL